MTYQKQKDRICFSKKEERVIPKKTNKNKYANKTHLSLFGDCE